MKQIMIALAIFSFMGLVAYAAENYEGMCGTIIEIYGVCSEELVKNFMDHQASGISRPLENLSAKLQQDAPPMNSSQFDLSSEAQSQMALATVGDTGINYSNGIWDIYNKGTEAPSSDGKTHYYLNSSLMDKTGNYRLPDGSVDWYEDVDYGIGYTRFGVNWANFSRYMLSSFSGWTTSNYSDNSTFSSISVTGQVNFSGQRWNITRRQELNATQGKINQTTVLGGSGTIGRDIYTLERHFNFTMGDNLRFTSVVNGSPFSTSLTDGHYWIFPYGQIEPYFLLESDTQSLAFEIDNRTGRPFVIEIINNQIMIMRNVGRINASNQSLSITNYWIDAEECISLCYGGCYWDTPHIWTNGTIDADADYFEAGTSMKVGLSVPVTCPGRGSCSTSGGCKAFLVWYPVGGTAPNDFQNVTTSTTYVKCNQTVCNRGGFYGSSVVTYVYNVSVKSEGNLTGSGGRLFAVDARSWDDTALQLYSESVNYNTTDRIKPNVTLYNPANDTNFSVTSWPYQVNLTCETNDSGYLNAQNTGYMNVSVFNATDGALYNSSKMYCTNYSHVCSKTAMMNFSQNGTFYWNCTVKDEAQLQNTTVPYWQFNISWVFAVVVQGISIESHINFPSYMGLDIAFRRGIYLPIEVYEWVRWSLPWRS